MDPYDPLNDPDLVNYEDGDLVEMDDDDDIFESVRKKYFDPLGQPYSMW